MSYQSCAQVIVPRFRQNCFERLVFNLQEEMATDGNPQDFCGFNTRLRKAIDLCDMFAVLEIDLESFLEELANLNMLIDFARLC